MSLVAPLVLADGIDVMFFDSSEEAARYVEPVDVRQGVYVAYDAMGTPLKLETDGTQVFFKPSMRGARELGPLRDLLLRFIKELGSVESASLQGRSNNELILFARSLEKAKLGGAPRARRLSSRTTFYFKSVIPILVFGSLILAPLIAFISGFESKDPWALVTAPVLLAGVYLLLFHDVWNLVDEVLDLQDQLLVRKGRDEWRIPLSAIVRVHFTAMSNPPSLTLTWRSGSDGRLSITVFVPRGFKYVFWSHPLSRELTQRVEASKRQGQAQSSPSGPSTPLK